MSMSNIVKVILAIQPVFVAPVFFSVLFGAPPLWASWIIALLPVFLRLWQERLLFRRTPFDIPVALFTAGIIVGCVVSPDGKAAGDALHTSLASILIYYGITSNRAAKNSYWMATGGVICLVVLGLAIWFFLQGTGKVLPFNEWAFRSATPMGEISGMQLNPHSLATALIVAIPAAFSLTLLRNSTVWRYLGLILGIVLLLVLVLTGSGSGWLVVTAVLTLMLLFCWPKAMGVALPLLAVMVWLVVANYGKIPWLSQVFGVDSVLSRVEMWRNTLGLLGDSPLGGLGLGAWFDVYNSHYGTEIVNAHNSYLQLYADTGILGGVALVAAAVMFVRLGWPVLKSSRQNPWYGVGLGIVTGIIAGGLMSLVETIITGTVVESGALSHYISIPLLWVWAALAVVAYHRLKDPALSEAS